MIDIPHIVEIFQIWPIIGLVVALGLVLMSSIFIEGRASKYFLLAVVWIGLGVAILSAVKLFSLTNIPTAVRDTQELFATNLISGSIIFDKIFLFMTVFLSVFLGGVLVLSVSLWRKPAWEWPVYLCLLLGSLVGMILLSSTRHMIFFAVAFELASMPSYVLVGFRKFNAKSAEGSAKYVVFGAVASAIMMYGISLLYGLTGSFDFQEIALSLSGGEVQVTKMMALVCLLVGVAFKISLVPAHFWCPDAFEAAGADVGAWLSVASKSAAIVALARFVQFLTLSGNDQFNHYVVLALTVLAIVTMTVANLSAYWQTSVKRLLAYSSIAHAGYIVCGLAVISGTAGLGAVIAYILVYLLDRKSVV